MTGGLDLTTNILETVGKKTFKVIQTNMKTNSSAGGGELSSLLREAKQRAASESDNVPSKADTKKSQEKPSFNLYFDEYKGGVHLEALEMLSHQASVKLDVLTQPKELNDTLMTIEELFDSEQLSNDAECDEPSDLVDFRLLINDKDNMFDIDHFELLINEYSRRFSNKLASDNLIASFRTTSLTSKEINSPIELVGEINFFF